MRDNVYIFGKKKDGAKENVISKEQLGAIAKEICEKYGITWDENATEPTLNGKPIKEEDIIRAFKGE